MENYYRKLYDLITDELDELSLTKRLDCLEQFENVLQAMLPDTLLDPEEATRTVKEEL